MQEHGMYFGKQDYYNTISMNGGAWNDSKERPLVCLIKSTENEHLYWAIPVGDWSHRTKEAQDRIKKYLYCLGKMYIKTVSDNISPT